MGLNGEKMLQSLKHLSQVDKMKQVEPMSYALFPGYHCPLMGAMLTIRAIKDSVMLVLGQMSVPTIQKWQLLEMEACRRMAVRSCLLY